MITLNLYSFVTLLSNSSPEGRQSLCFLGEGVNEAFADNRLIGCISHEQQENILLFDHTARQQSSSTCILHCGVEMRPLAFFDTRTEVCICGEFNNK